MRKKWQIMLLAALAAMLLLVAGTGRIVLGQHGSCGHVWQKRCEKAGQPHDHGLLSR